MHEIIMTSRSNKADELRNWIMGMLQNLRDENIKLKNDISDSQE